ncbi:GSCFA domain-containing protein [Tamlana sp. I1]|uniref:GSCFA domain-containing protein n=1 Tax=Tamlana sp. I1 TaxID=2762061 RepID=UPI00189044F7|nr:GSCFA domain-containing protein [Tamlana sp. I1]
MNLQTKIPLEKRSDATLDYHSKLLLFGSCFSENIGDKLAYFKFQNHQNPFGILFHPLAIKTLIAKAISNKTYSESDVFFQNEQWHCFDAHSKLSDVSKENLIKTLNETLVATHEQLKNATHIIITFGTAWVYRFLETQNVVANCHKIPQKQFKKTLLSVEEVYNVLEVTVELIKSVNPECNIIFTVSPVRHLKDGFVENTQSKAHLVAAIHQLLKLNSNKLFYFPSYELMMDELRDYRFYNEDMVHPNPLAIQYIWERFKKVWISDSALKTMDTVEGIQKALQHKPFNANSKAHEQFLKQLEIKKEALQKEYSHIVF